MASIPKQHRWVFWDVKSESLDAERDALYILGRALEFGGIDEIHWLIDCFGLERIHAFLREVGHVEITERTKKFWRAFFKAEDEPWADPGGWRRNIDAPWPG